MKLLKAGDPCPCCGRPIKEGLPTGTMIFLSWLAEGMALRKAAKSGEGDHEAAKRLMDAGVKLWNFLN